jgi:hypothetical protein
MSFSLSALSRKTSNKSIYRILGLVVIGIILILLWLWWHFDYTKPTNVFNGMISSSLSTNSFAKEVTQNASGQYLSQYTVIETGGHDISESVTKIDTPSQKTYVTTESIGTPSSDYEEYTHISTGVTDSKKTTPKFGPAIGVWGSSVGSTTTNGQLFNSTILGYIPIGDLTSPQKASLIKLIKTDNVYKFSTNVKKKTVDGRLRYTYKVVLNPVAYIEMIKQFGADLGLNQLSTVSDESMGETPLPFYVTVDVLSRHLVSITASGSNRIESFSSYGINTQINIPKKTVPISQLEELLESLN